MSACTALTAAGYRAQVRDKTTVFFTFAFPLIFLVVFGLLFRGQDVKQSGFSYLFDIGRGCAGLVAFAVVLGAVAVRTFRWTKTS